MKKALLTIALAVAMLFGLSSCKEPDPTSNLSNVDTLSAVLESSDTSWAIGTWKYRPSHDEHFEEPFKVVKSNPALDELSVDEFITGLKSKVAEWKSAVEYVNQLNGNNSNVKSVYYITINSTKTEIKIGTKSGTNGYTAAAYDEYVKIN